MTTVVFVRCFRSFRLSRTMERRANLCLRQRRRRRRFKKIDYRRVRRSGRSPRVGVCGVQTTTNVNGFFFAFAVYSRYNKCYKFFRPPASHRIASHRPPDENRPRIRLHQPLPRDADDVDTSKMIKNFPRQTERARATGALHENHRRRRRSHRPRNQSGDDDGHARPRAVTQYHVRFRSMNHA
jgi:hypothetical protein